MFPCAGPEIKYSPSYPTISDSSTLEIELNRSQTLILTTATPTVGFWSHPMVGVAVFAPKSPWSIEFLM